MSQVLAQSIKLNTGGLSQVIPIGAASAQSTALYTDSFVMSATVDCFIRFGENPVALADGTDHFLPGDKNSYRVMDFLRGNKIAVIAVAGPGSLYLTPGA